MTVLVVGAGIAGSSAAFAAAKGAAVQVVSCGLGATEFALGSLVATPGWLSPPTQTEQELLRAFGLNLPVERPIALCNHVGVVQAAPGAEQRLLDVGALGRGATLGVTTLGRHAYGALTQVACDEFLQQAGVRVVVVEPPEFLLAWGAVPDVDLAHQLERPDSFEQLKRWLAAGPTVNAWLLPPCLGVKRQLGSELKAALGVPIGESLPVLGGLFGERFRVARQALFESSGVQSRTGTVRRLQREGQKWHVELELPSGRDSANALGNEIVSADTVILAVGGVSSGGVELGRPRDAEARLDPSYQHFQLGLEAPFDLMFNDQLVENVSAKFGLDIQAVGLSSLTDVGISDQSAKTLAPQGLVAVGDVVAARPRTLLAALRSGARAGALASQGESQVAEE